MADFWFILVAFGLVWFGFSIYIWFGGSPEPSWLTTAPHSPRKLAYHRPWTDKKEKKEKKNKRRKKNEVGYRVAAQLKISL